MNHDPSHLEILRELLFSRCARSLVEFPVSLGTFRIPSAVFA